MAAKKKVTTNGRATPTKAALGTRNGSAKDLGRTDAAATPLEIRTQGLKVQDALVEHVHTKLGARLGKYALHIDRVTVRFEDLNGPRGGVDTECRVQVAMPTRPLLVVTERATDAWRAFDGVCASLTRAVKRDLDRSGHSKNRGPARHRVDEPARAAAKNGRAEVAETPARKRVERTSTRKSATHTKSGEGLAERAVSRAHSPSQRASAAKARARR